jgi:hypothetical protein
MEDATGCPVARSTWSQVDLGHSQRSLCNPLAAEDGLTDDADDAIGLLQPASDQICRDDNPTGPLLLANDIAEGAAAGAADVVVLKKPGKCADCGKQCTKNWFEYAPCWFSPCLVGMKQL